MIFKLKKKHAKTNIIFVENLEMDPDDKWFIDINSVNKSGDIKNTVTIIKPDLTKWLNGYLREGWTIIDDNDE